MAGLGNGLRERFAEDLHNDGSLGNQETKRRLIGALRKLPLTVTQSADTSALDSATYTDSADLVVKLEGGRVYRVSGYAHLTQATAADGLKTRLNLTGTQTTAFVNGFLHSWVDNGAAADAVAGPTAMTISSGVTGELSDADSTAILATWDFVIVPQNDGVLTVQYGEVADGGAAGAVLKKGSWLEVREISSRNPKD